MSLCGLLTNSSGTTHSLSQVGLAGLDLQPGSCPHVHVLIFTEIRKYCVYLGGHPCNIKAAFTCACSVAKQLLAHTILPAYIPPTQAEATCRRDWLVVWLFFANTQGTLQQKSCGSALVQIQRKDASALFQY